MKKLDLEIFRPRRITQRSGFPSVSITPLGRINFSKFTSETIGLVVKGSIMIGVDSGGNVYVRAMPNRDGVNCFSARVAGRGSFYINSPEFIESHNLTIIKKRYPLVQVEDFWRIDGFVVTKKTNT